MTTPHQQDAAEIESAQPADVSDRPAKTPENKVQAEKQWGSAFEFIVTSLGFAVGLGNIWRFPNMVFSNGGGVFLIPYTICLIFIAIPLLLVEAALGQYSHKGPIGIWDMSPLFRGCGIAAVVLSCINCVYYNAPISWAAFYLVSSMNSPLPWTQCGSWSTANCSEDGALGEDLMVMHSDSMDATELESMQSKATSPAEEYFYKRALGITSGLRDWGTLTWELLVCNLVVWLIIFVVICKGAESLGKVAYFTTLFPYVMLTALLAFTATLPGADIGVKFYLDADPSRLTDVKVWRSAVSQVFFSTGCAGGGVIQMASYNKFQHNIVRDTILVPLLDGLTSLYAGFGVFTVLGYMAQQRGVTVGNVVESGPGLIFVTYPEALSQMPGSAAWSFLFFFMVCILGLSSQFPSIETICSTVGDYLPWTQSNWLTKILFRFGVCMLAFLCGIFFYFGNGYFSYYLIDERVIGYPMILIGFVEAAAVSWVYGSNHLMSNIEEMTGPWRWKWLKFFWIACWKVVAPCSLFLIFVLDIATLEPLEVLGYKFPTWAMGVAGFILSIPLACMVLYALHIYCRACEGYKFLRKATVPMESWRPSVSNLQALDEVIPKPLSNSLGSGLELRELGIDIPDSSDEDAPHINDYSINAANIHADQNNRRRRRGLNMTTNTRQLNPTVTESVDHVMPLHSSEPVLFMRDQESSDDHIKVPAMAESVHAKPSISQTSSSLSLSSSSTTNTSGDKAIAMSCQAVTNSKSPEEIHQQDPPLPAAIDDSSVQQRPPRRLPRKMLAIQHNDQNKSPSPISQTIGDRRSVEETVEFCV